MKRIAFTHDHLAQNGGAERVLAVLHEMYPNAPTYTTLWDKKKSDPVFANKEIYTSFIQKFPFGVKKYQWYLPFMPLAFERFNFDAYDLVISSNSALAKGVILPEGVKHVCYCYTPTRYLWSDRNQYIENLNLPSFVKHLLYLYLSYLRTWDLEAARRVDHFVAISNVVKERIQHYYKRESVVVYPPVDIDPFSIGEGRGGYYLAGGRLTYYKRFDIIVDAFSKMNMPLYIYGDGPERGNLENRAKPNIHFLGRISEKKLHTLYKDAIAFINPQEEDFGITMVEAMASGCPVIAFNKGGALDIVQKNVSGAFFDEQSWESLSDTVIRFDRKNFDPQRIRVASEKFSKESFKKEFTNYLVTNNLL